MLTSKELRRVAHMESVYAGSPRYRPMRASKPHCGKVVVVRFRKGKRERISPLAKVLPHRNLLGQFTTAAKCRWFNRHPPAPDKESKC